MFRGAQRRGFRAQTDAEATSQRRQEDRLELRSKAREQNLQKRRKHQSQNNNDLLQTQFQEDVSILDPVTQDRLRNLNSMANILRTGSEEQKQKTVEQIRKLLSIEKTPPIQSVINAGLVEDLMNILRDHSNNEKLRFEAAWALTNVASGSSNHTRVVVNHGGVDVFVSILMNEEGDIKEQAVWALGNIAGDCAELRDRVLRADALRYLMNIFRTENFNQSLLRNATWTLSNFCRGKPHADFEILRPCLELLVNLLQVQDEEILVDTCWAISYISDDPTANNVRIQEVIEHEFVPHLIALLEHDSPFVIHPALRAVGNIVTGTDTQTQCVIDNGVLPYLKNLLENDKVGIRKEACWTVSNITAGNVPQIESVIRAQLIGPILRHLNSAIFEIRKEACWAISNATAGGNDEQISYLVQQGCIEPLVRIVEFANPKTVRVALEGLENILKSGQDNVSEANRNPYVPYIEEANGFEAIARLQDGQANGVGDKVARILLYSPRYQNEYAV